MTAFTGLIILTNLCRCCRRFKEQEDRQEYEQLFFRLQLPFFQAASMCLHEPTPDNFSVTHWVLKNIQHAVAVRGAARVFAEVVE